MLVVMAAAFASAESDSHCDAEVCGQSSKGDSGSHALLQVRADGTATKVHVEKPGSTSATLDSATALKDAAAAIKTSLAAATTKAEASEEGEAIQKILAKASEEGKAKDGEKKDKEKKDDEPAAEEKKEKKKDEEMKEAEVQRPRPTRKKRRKSSNSGKQDQSGQNEPDAKSSESGETDASGHEEPDAEDVPADTDDAPADGKDDADNHDTAPKEGKDAGQADLGEAGEAQSKAIADEEADGEGSDDTNEVLIEQGMKIFPEGTRP